MKKILITGATGFFGTHVKKVLDPLYTTFSVGSKDYDLLDLNQADQMFNDIHPEIVVQLASRVGGILANRSYKATFWYENMLMTAHVWELCKKYSVQKLIYPLPGCSYPAISPAPMKEEDIWNGFPDSAPAPGALAKKMGLIASIAYRQQYGLDSSVIIPANMYGEHDHYEEYNSHVIPALITKMHKAKKAGDKQITLWGSGNAIRDFIYASDVASMLPYFIENKCEEPVNLSTGIGCTIKELAETIAKVVGFQGELLWDISKPEGPMDKRFDNSKMKQLGLTYKTSLEEGLKKTYSWYLAQQ